MNAKQKWMIGGAFALVVVLVAAAFAWFAGSDATEPTTGSRSAEPRAFSAGQQRGNRIRGPHHRSGRSESDDSEQSCGNDPSAARLPGRALSARQISPPLHLVE